MCLFLLFVREPRVGHSYSEIRSRFPTRLVAAAAGKSHGSFFSFLLASINLSSSFARDSFFQHADYARVRARNWVGCYRARVSSRIIMLNEREVTGNVSSLRIRCGQEEREEEESRAMRFVMLK